MTATRSRAATGDRGPPGDAEILTVEQIGPKRHRTPNGNMLCEGVPIARVGWMMYGPDETPIKVNKDTGFARVYRSEEELFSPKTIGSFMGVAVVDEHPEDDVTPKNWNKLGKGFTTTNVYRGEGEYADCLLADLIVTDEDLIKSIDSGKREVSCGYDADYEQTGDGTGIQANIIGNHIALVERGRCGPRCAIGDHAPTLKETKMASKQRKTIDRAKLRVMVKDMESLLQDTQLPGDGDEEGDDDGDEGGTHIHIHQHGAGEPATPAVPAARTPGADEGGEPGAGEGDPLEARISAIEQTVATLADAVNKLVGGAKAGDEADPGKLEGEGNPVKDEADPGANPEDEEGKPVKTTDSAALATSFTQLIADAEILVPGFRAPTFDAKAKRTATIDRMCSIRRKVIDTCCATTAGQELMTSISGSKDLDLTGKTCVEVSQLFRAAVGAQKLLNNRAATGDAARLPTTPAKTQKGPTSIADMNKVNAEFWSKRGA